MTAVEGTFEAIAENAMAEAARVKCSLEEYVSGLEAIIGYLESAKESAEADLARAAEEDPKRRKPGRQP